jgi:hypothetical protein
MNKNGSEVFCIFLDFIFFVALGFEPTLQGSHACKVGALST